MKLVAALAAVSTALLAAPFASTALAEEAPARAASGQSLQVLPEHASLGTVYHLQPGKDAQVTFTSDAPLEHIKGVTNQVVGYVVAGAEAPARLQGGAFRLPVSSFDTGIPLRDEHMQGERWLHAESHPDIMFVIDGTTDVREAQSGDGFTTYRVTLVGDLTVRGVTRRMEIPARLTFMPESDRTRSRAKGDLLALRCEYEVKLGDFGVDNTGGGKVADVITLDQALFFATVRPEDQR